MFLDRKSIFNRKIVIYPNFVSFRSSSSSCVFPAYVKSWIYLTPFPYLIDFPANILSGNATNVSGGLSMQSYGLLFFTQYLKNYGLKGQKIYCYGIMKTNKYLKVYSKFLHTSLASELEYKTNILSI